MESFKWSRQVSILSLTVVCLFFPVNKYSLAFLNRKKDIYDGAVPSGNSVELMNLIRFFRITSDFKYSEYAKKLIRAFASIVERMPVGFTQFLNGFDSAISHFTEIVLTAKSKEEIKQFLEVIRNYYLPNKVVIFRSEINKTELAKIADYTSNLEMINNKPTAYICSNYACEIPITDVKEFVNKLNKKKNQQI